MTTNDAPFRFSQQGPLSTLQLQPELNNVQWGEIESIGTEVLKSLETQAHPHLIIDLSPLSYMGSAMVALIVRVWKATQAKDGKICVVCPHESVKEVLKLASLDKVWSIVPSIDQAHKTLGVSGGTTGSSSSPSTGGTGKGPWIIVAILLLICAVLVAFVLNPDWIASNKPNEKESPVIQPEEPMPNEPIGEEMMIPKQIETKSPETSPLPKPEPEPEQKQKQAEPTESKKTTENKTETKEAPQAKAEPAPAN